MLNPLVPIDTDHLMEKTTIGEIADAADIVPSEVKYFLLKSPQDEVLDYLEVIDSTLSHYPRYYQVEIITRICPVFAHADHQPNSNNQLQIITATNQMVS